MNNISSRLLTALCALILSVSSLWAVPARPGWQTKTQPDGTPIVVQLMGDEFGHYWMTKDGKIAEPQEDGTFVVTDEDIPTGEQMAKRRMASKRFPKNAKMVGAGYMPTRALFILVSFSDQTFKSTSETYYKSKLGDKTDGAMSMYNYLKLQSNGQYAPPVDVYGPYTLSNTYATYGANNDSGDDVNPAQMIVDACKAADNDIDFSQYDGNNDGKVDNVYVLYAGKGEADGGAASTVWPHQWDIYYGGLSLKLDGKNIRNYACSAELNGSGKCAMGTPLHEFGHVIGLPDYYDTKYASTNYSESRTPGQWSIMDGGSYNNDGNTPPNYSIFDKYYLGWETPKFLAKDEAKNVTLTTAWDDAYQITGGTSRVAATATSPATVYYIENRQKSGWDEYLPGHGMIVWQVKYNSTAWNNNTLNNTGGSPRYTVLSASGDPKNIGKNTDPFPGTSRVKSCTPVTGCAMTEITESGGNITFKYNGGVNKTKAIYEFIASNCTTPADGEVAINAALNVTITPNSGYTLNDPSCWTVEMGGVELTYGSDFTYNASTNTFSIASLTDDVVIMAEAKQIFTVTWSVNGSTTATNYIDGASLSMPATTPSDCPGGKKFVGWTTSTSVTGDKPADLFTAAGTKTVTANVTYYAVYATATTGGGSSTWTLVTDASSLRSGDVLVIASNTEGKTAGDISSSVMSEVASTFSSDKSTITSLGTNTVELTLGGSEGAWTLTSSSGQLGATAVKKLAWDSGTTTWEISISDGDATIQNGTSTYGRFLHNVTNTRFSTYTSATNTSMLLPQIYRKGGGVSYSDYGTTCVICALSSISLNTDNVKKSFTTDDTFTSAGLVVTANYSNCSSRTVTPADVSTPSLTTAGDKTVTVTYTENEVTKTATYTINVTAVVKHTVTWITCGGTTFKTEQYVDGTALVLPSPAPGANTEGKAFYGWTTESSYTGADAPAVISAGSAVTADATYYAVYK
ncbi:MAG: M6 family metalloprotease domain-containing protein [Paludibacteraceae bacterium]|nr:M6 family metalloprotease domain-containing protein [Paludibacteraceae bacterium]